MYTLQFAKKYMYVGIEIDCQMLLIFRRNDMHEASCS